jgi:cell division protein FtsI/penicillin-binding protein 2
LESGRREPCYLEPVIAPSRVLRAWLAVLLLVAAGTEAGAAARGRSRRPRSARRLAALIPPSVVVPEGASARDVAVAEAARRALSGVGGAVVAMDPYTGRVLGIVNPGAAVERAFQPCSVFKIVVAIAGLTEGVITPSTLITCDGGCWFWPGHGPTDLRRALANSCNPYFQRVGERLGYEKIQRYAQLLGLGSRSGINVPGDEAAGRVPYYVGQAGVAKLSSHAEGITASAVQLAVLLSAVVNGGVVFQPQLSGAADFAPKERWRLPRGTVLQGLADGFLSAVNEGSAADAFDPDIVVAGKTGTCAGLGWFASYAPADKPEMVLVVFLRSATGHQASSVAGRIYQDLYKPLPGTLAAGREGPAPADSTGGPLP